jgi:hypothetical protein
MYPMQASIKLIIAKETAWRLDYYAHLEVEPICPAQKTTQAPSSSESLSLQKLFCKIG